MTRGKYAGKLVPLLVGLLMVGTVLIGCDTGLLPGAGDTDPAPEGGLWSAAPPRVSTIRIGADGGASSSVARSLSENDRVYFRSSDIEFWHIDSVEEIGNLVSTKYVGTIDYALNHSLEYRIGDDASGINANSIFFVDQAFLSEPILITRVIEQEVIAGIATAESIGISDDDFAIVDVLHTSSNWNDESTPIDVNGALILPLSPVDLTGFDPISETLDIVVSWEIANAVQLRDGEYFMDNRVGGTAFDFTVQVVRGTK